MNKNTTVVACIACLSVPLCAEYQGVNGGVVAIDLPVGSEYAEFNGQRQLVVDGIAIVGIPYEQEPGEYSVRVHFANNLYSEIPLLVESKKYPEQHINVDQKYVTPPQETLDRISREAELMKAAYARRSPQSDGLFPLLIPVTGQVTGVFGSRRFFNGQPRNPHSGIDYAADTGTPIRSPAPGTVALTRDMYFNGKTVVIDHGSGFMSVMCHLDEFSVEEDQEIEKGDTVGTVGATGRVTGPHLHWTISLQGTKIDPAVFIEVTNEISARRTSSDNN